MRYRLPKRYRDLLLRPFSACPTLPALSDFSLSVFRGDCIGLLGPNGAGKTTLLRLLAALIYPTEGTVSIGTFDTQSQPLEARRSVGYVLNEDRSFFWRLSAIENLEFFGALDNLVGVRLRRRIDETLSLVGISQAAARRRVSDFSSGMRQRLAIARAMLIDPTVLLLDEPTRSLDPDGAEDIQTLLHTRLRDQKQLTIVIATHDLLEAELLCNRVCFLNQGRLMLEKHMNLSTADRPVDLKIIYRTAVSNHYSSL